MDIWKEKASGPLHSVHVGYGVGGFIVPQIVKPFISKQLPINEKTNTSSGCEVVITSPFTNFTLNAMNKNDSTLSNATRNFFASTLSNPSSNLKYGFFIISGIITVIAFIWLFFFLLEKKHTASSSSYDEENSTRSIKKMFNFNT